MAKAIAVIGANYGDEGKGLVVNAKAQSFTCGERVAVVRFNGGAQAGHTVKKPNGDTHIFSQFGSGSLSGADTILSKFFIINPTLFIDEYQRLAHLKSFNFNRVSVSDAVQITTPYDMITNQAIETIRSNGRHGSCGRGIFETIRRDPSLTISDLRERRAEKKVRVIHQNAISHLNTRLEECGLSFESDEQRDYYYSILSNSKLRDEFLIECDALKMVEAWSLWYNDIDREAFNYIDNVASRYKHFIFEGAQGLLLDQNNTEEYPYLTPSNTGVKNLNFLCKQLNIDEIEVIYVTRTYLTRHGAGPLHNEENRQFTEKDDTNVPNPWQGAIRYAPLYAPKLFSRIVADFAQLDHPRKTMSLAVTHSNDDGIMIPYITSEGKYTLYSKDLISGAIRMFARRANIFNRIYRSCDAMTLEEVNRF